ncbi:MAG: hypothetical protein KDA60_01700 [Planctomycetales bacterium]|nr:hypothetical protein [Planctomycetales bacterium]
MRLIPREITMTEPPRLRMSVARCILAGLLLFSFAGRVICGEPESGTIPDAVQEAKETRIRVVRHFGSRRFRHANGYQSITALAFSPDESRIASVGSDHTVRVWGLDGREHLRLVGEEWARFTSVTFSPNGKWLAANGDRGLSVWDISTTEVLLHVPASKGSKPVFSTDSRRVAATVLQYTPMAGYVDRSFRVWDVASRELLRSLDSSDEMHWPLAVAPDVGLAARLDSPVGQSIKLLRLDTGETVCTYDRHLGTIHSVAFRPDGKMVASSSLKDGVLEVHCWDALTGETRSRIQRTTSFAKFAVHFSPTGDELVGEASTRDLDGGYADGYLPVDLPAEIEVMNATNARRRFAIKQLAAPALSSDGQTLAAASFNRIQLFNAKSGKSHIEYSGHDASVQEVAVSRDSQRLASVGRDHTLRYWEASTGELLRVHDIPGGIGDASFSGDLARVAVLHGALENNDRRRITVWSEGHDRPLLDLAMPNGDRLVAISGDGSTLATWGQDDLRIWKLVASVPSAEPVKIVPPSYPIAISGFALSDDGRHVFAGAMSEPIRMWDTQTGELVRVFEPNAERMRGRFGGPFALTSDGKSLATYLDDSIVVYELNSGRRTATLPRQTTGHVAELAFSHDGRLLASSARDGSVRVLDLETGSVIGDVQAHGRGWTSIAFSRQANRLISGGGDAIVTLWAIDSLRP